MNKATVLERLFPPREAWDQVREAPLNNNKIVFTKGTPKQGICIIPNGGQMPPLCTAAANLEWKKHQKREKNNITSLKIKSKNPYFINLDSTLLIYPLLFSEFKSVIHKKVKIEIKINDKKNKLYEPERTNHNPNIRNKKEKPILIGHGLKYKAEYNRP